MSGPESATERAEGEGEGAPGREVSETPPFWGSWRRIYVGLLVLLVVYIVSFYACTVVYR